MMKSYTVYPRRIGRRWVAAIVVGLAFFSTHLSANDDKFTVSLSGGYAKQNFDVAGYTTTETTDSTLTVALGWDISDRITLEHHWYNLGSYRFDEDEPSSAFSYSPTANVTGIGAAALYYFVGSRGVDGISNRRGFNLYAKVAATLIGGDLWFGNPEAFEDEIDGWHPGLGIGIEYGLQPVNLAFRAAVETLSDKLVFGSVSVMWRWGHAN